MVVSASIRVYFERFRQIRRLKLFRINTAQVGWEASENQGNSQSSFNRETSRSYTQGFYVDHSCFDGFWQGPKQLKQFHGTFFFIVKLQVNIVQLENLNKWFGCVRLYNICALISPYSTQILWGCMIKAEFPVSYMSKNCIFDVWYTTLDLPVFVKETSYALAAWRPLVRFIFMDGRSKINIRDRLLGNQESYY